MQLDIIVIKGTKMDTSVNSAEFLPKNHDGSIQRNRSSSGGGVMIATKKGMVVDKVPPEASKAGEITC